eukprot:678973-Amorphochlora_amoeboformis.AAC.1
MVLARLTLATIVLQCVGLQHQEGETNQIETLTPQNATPNLDLAYGNKVKNFQAQATKTEIQTSTFMETKTQVSPYGKSGEHTDGESTPAYAFAVQSLAVTFFLAGIVLHMVDRWSWALVCFVLSFTLDILVTHVAAWSGHNSDLAYTVYRTFALLTFRTGLILLVIAGSSTRGALWLAIWSFLDITSTTLMFMACDYLNNVSYENGNSHYLSPLTWAYSNPESRFALEYGTMFFLIALYELISDKNLGAPRRYDYAGLGRRSQGKVGD